MTIRDGRHDRGSNGIWLQHGWLGDDAWFDRYGKDRALFRSDERVASLATLLSDHGIKYVFPHLCPCDVDGGIAAVDGTQTERFLDHFHRFEVVPWVGSVLGEHAFPESSRWRNNFVASVADLLRAHPRLAGVQVNIEPMPSGTLGFLDLLDELRAAMPREKVLSVAAYPPPTILHPFPAVHWDEGYLREVAKRVDQIVPMMYDTALSSSKLYRNLMAAWTTEILAWSEGSQVLLGVPAYDTQLRSCADEAYCALATNCQERERRWEGDAPVT